MSKAIITEQHLHDIADAIIAKGGATEAMTPAQMPAAIQAIQGWKGPKPWIGSGTNFWLHFDADTPTHQVKLRLTYIGTGTIDWGDGTTETLPNSTSDAWARRYESTVHTFANGDYIVKVSGYDSIALRSNAIFANLLGMTDGSSTLITWAVEQFETDATTVELSSGSAYNYFARTANLKYVKFTEFTGNIKFLDMIGLRGVYLPKATSFILEGNTPRGSLREIIAPNAVPKDNYTMNELVSLEHLEISSGLTELRNNFLNRAILIREYNIPRTVTSIPGSCFVASAIEHLDIPEGVTTIAGMCQICYNLKSIILPSTLSEIGNLTLYDVQSLLYVEFRSTTPPNVTANNVLQNLSTNAVIKVPYSADHSILDAYKVAPNLSRFASQMTDEEQ